MSVLLLTLYFWTVTAIANIIGFLLCLICYVFVDCKTFGQIYSNFAGGIMLHAMTLPGFWQIKMTDLRHTSDEYGNDEYGNDKYLNKRYIIISNHASFVDTLITNKLPISKKFIMAKEFATVPIFGWLCRNSGHVLVCDHDRDSLSSALDLSVKAMEDGSSFMIYPEGRRSANPYMVLPFKTGAFRLAQKTGVPILPIVIKGTGTAMPIGGWCYPAHIEIVIGHPIYIGTSWSNIKQHPSIEETRKFMMTHLQNKIN